MHLHPAPTRSGPHEPPRDCWYVKPHFPLPSPAVPPSHIRPSDRTLSVVTTDERWKPIHSIESILMSVISMLSAPNFESPANVDAAVSSVLLPHARVTRSRSDTLRSSAPPCPCPEQKQQQADPEAFRKEVRRCVRLSTEEIPED